MSPIRNPDNTLELTSSLKGGFISAYEVKDIPLNNTVAQNNFLNYQGSIRVRNGTTKYPTAKPNSNSILHLGNYVLGSVSTYIFRHTGVSLHRLESPGPVWTNITGASFGGTKIRSFYVPNLGYVFCDGLNAIQYVAGVGTVCAVLGNAPVASYIVQYGNRIVSAQGNTLSWCGDLNYTQWNAAVDISAGTSPIADSADDLAETITGLITVGQNIIALKERSIWIGSLQASASNPFYFRKAIDKLGCDTPFSLAKIPGGFCFLDFDSQNIYKASVDQGNIQLEAIGSEVYNSIISTTPNVGHASYDATVQEYWYWQGSNKFFGYSLIEKGWHERDLSGSIFGLGAPTKIYNYADIGFTNTKKFYALDNGDILYEAPNTYQDDTFNFNPSLTSRTFTAKNPAKQLLMEYVSVTYVDNATGTMTLSVVDDSTNTLRVTKTITLLGDAKTRRIIIRKPIKALSMYFTLSMTRTSGGQTRIEDYSFKAYEVGNL